MSLNHICMGFDIDETASIPEEKPERTRSLRAELANLWSIVDMARSVRFGQPMFKSKKKFKNVKYSLADFKALLEYSLYITWSRKRREPVNVESMIKRWTDWIVTFTTAHSKEEVDQAEYVIDELLNPMLTAPVKQLREFWKGLVKSLQTDKRVPLYVHQWFSAWGKVVIDNAEDDQKVLKLKKKLAAEVADLVEKHGSVKIDLQEALVGALMWRSEESLQEIKTDLEAGAKPRIKGRQSCLFLTTKRRGKNAKEHTVML